MILELLLWVLSLNPSHGDEPPPPPHGVVQYELHGDEPPPPPKP